MFHVEHPDGQVVRREHDLLGEKDIPVDAYYGIHTMRARENFSLSGLPSHPRLIEAIALVKKAAAEANMELGFLDKEIGAAISQAASEVMAGQFRDQFIVDALQGGAGTSTHMNVNEVIANRACELIGAQKGDYHRVHPLEHVNLGQSTNDVYPTGLRIAAIWLIRSLCDACAQLQEELQAKEREFAGVIKVGRTQLQDAVPVLLGQEFGAYAQAVARDRWRLYKAEERLRQVNLGGTAIGTGLNADIRYIHLVNEKTRRFAGVGIARAEDMVDATQNADVFVEVSGLLKALAVNLTKICNDLRLLASGPYAGLGEIRLPEKQAGSSIMPGKVNPVIPEAVNQAAFHVMASDMAITLAAQAGQLELNAFLPLLAHHLLGSIGILTNAAKSLAFSCIQGISACPERCQALLLGSGATATALAPHIGYDRATELARMAYHSGRTIEKIALEENILTAEELAAILRPQAMTRPGRGK
ncbi:MAG: aspA [Anaerosporomusa subterranea]|nr:aspA [Anaerosporomusa subterranea]